MHDKENFAECVAQHLPYLNRMIQSLTGRDPMTEDIVQQTMLKALVHAGGCHTVAVDTGSR
jgi:DNA-directed RNA polymerase specialized sigma24 family protein